MPSIEAFTEFLDGDPENAVHPPGIMLFSFLLRYDSIYILTCIRCLYSARLQKTILNDSDLF